MNPDEIAAHFTRSDGSYRFARWGRPVAPMVVGVDDATLAIFKGALTATHGIAGRDLAEIDPEIGANLMIFVIRDWDELRAIPDIHRLLPDFDPLLARLDGQGANQYRAFRFDPAGAIRAAFVFVRLDAALAALPAETVALDQAARTILMWSETAFAARSPLAEAGGGTVLRPEIAALICAAHDPVMPDAADDPSHALRLAARMP